jgi:hypothetical protein
MDICVWIYAYGYMRMDICVWIYGSSVDCFRGGGGGPDPPPPSSTSKTVPGGSARPRPPGTSKLPLGGPPHPPSASNKSLNFYIYFYHVPIILIFTPIYVMRFYRVSLDAYNCASCLLVLSLLYVPSKRISTTHHATNCERKRQTKGRSGQRHAPQTVKAKGKHVS